MHKNAFGGRAPPGPAGGSYSAPPDPVAVINYKGEGKGMGRKRCGRGGKGGGGKGRT